MDIDFETLRRDTPGCKGNIIHLNNAGASLMPQPVLSALSGHVELESRIGGYEAAAASEDAISGFYDAIAALLNGHRDEVAFLDSATRAWHAAFHAMEWHPADVILTARSEYNANMVSFLHARKRYGIEFRLVPDTVDGTIDTEALRAMICPKTRLICLSHMPTNDGLVNPVEEVGKIAREHGLPFLLDACQSAGQMPLDVEAIGCTMVSATGRKYLRGPRGTGFLWAHADWIEKLEPYALDIRSASWCSASSYKIADGAQRFELWENNIAGQIALGEAARYAMAADIGAMWPRIQELARALREKIDGREGFSVHDQGTIRSGIVTFSHPRLSAAEIVAHLHSRHTINTSLSASQLTRADLAARGVSHMVRASVHAYNTTSELDALVEALVAMARQKDTGLPHANKNNKASNTSIGVEQ
ncbi:aminotransferase class V-fold PLP-dependent enzyme [Pelagibacterium lacus]|uniref:Aminotransferase class V-fold PLP-dependent enzyme n=1 Tax=Pelagibacterium lacus TaxID=2282655 RepID=A0A369W3J1_9HYPH|nr:aminotransferase class V-fold PLP-dependent enzyme [Pelagibacterium lacus]RDE08609.1 aminotransferase class V-fold PLP-dependent enzyme [Pelagibacterium lacus]